MAIEEISVKEEQKFTTEAEDVRRNPFVESSEISSEKVEEQCDTDAYVEDKGEQGNEEKADGKENTEESELDSVIQIYSTKHTQAEAIRWVKDWIWMEATAHSV